MSPACPGPREEERAADQQRKCRASCGEEPEHTGVGFIGSQPHVARDGVEHRVHRESPAQPEAEREAVVALAGLGLRDEQVAEGAELFGRGVEVGARVPSERDGALVGVDADGRQTGVFGQGLFDEPDATDARDAAQPKAQGAGPGLLGRGLGHA